MLAPESDAQLHSFQDPLQLNKREDVSHRWSCHSEILRGLGFGRGRQKGKLLSPINQLSCTALSLTHNLILVLKLPRTILF